MSTRLQLNRSLSLHLNGLSKDGQTSPPLDSQGSNLSPSIQPDIQSFSSLIKLSQQCSTQANSPNEDSNSNSNQTVLSDSNQELSQKCSTKGDFLLLESNPQVDCFNSAINTKTQKIYYWKKFDVKHYMKKLEAYFIMEGASDKIYKFSQIVLDSSTQSAGQASKWAYVFFEPHFGDLHSYMKEKKRLEESEAKHIYRQCVQAVMDCHDNGIIIRDIKLKKLNMMSIVLITLSVVATRMVEANWWNLGLKTSLFSSNTIAQVHNLADFCQNLDGLTLGQSKLCELYSDHVTAIAKGARIGIMECQWQFRFNQWNCSTISNSSVYGPIIEEVPSRESAFVHAVSAAGVLQAIARSCRNGDISTCGCSTSKRPANLNKDWVWGGCGDNVEYGYKFSKHFVDMTEKSVTDDKRSLQVNRLRFRNRFRKSESNDLQTSFEVRRAKATKLMNLHNNEAGRRAVYRMVKIECKCHGVSGSCSMKTCWLKLPSFREVGDYLKEKYDSAIEVRYELRQNQLRPRYRRFSKPTKEDLVYIQDSPNYCNYNEKIGILGTSGRQCNKNSNGPDGCRIMCCGRGYYIQKTIKEEKCKCKFQWCCSVKCETCITEVETYICK